MRSWTTYERDHLRQMYLSKKSAEDIAQSLGRTPGAVRQRIVIDGLSPGARAPGWSKQELEILEDCGSVPFKKIFQKLKIHWNTRGTKGRSESAVQRKISEIGYSRKLEADYYNLSQIAKGLRSSHQTPHDWLKDKDMKKILKPMGMNPVLIHYKNLRAFFKAYPGEVAKHSPDILWLLSIVFEE